MSIHKNLGDEPSPEKEDAVREALGVEKKYFVYVTIPVTGSVHLKEIVVMAVNEDDAKAKTKELVLNGGIDAAGCETEECEHDYDYEPSPGWDIEISSVD